MKSYCEWKEKDSKIITITCRDNADTLEELLKYIKSVGNMGHTFTIVVDPKAKGGKTFEWDGLRLAFNIEGEPTEL